MLKLHHLVSSRSQRILWLLEELGLDYELVIYPRDPKTNLIAYLERLHARPAYQRALQRGGPINLGGQDKR